MSEYRCPNCTGEFPDLDDGCCPWCGQHADQSYEYEPRVHKLKKREDDEKSKSGILSLFK